MKNDKSLNIICKRLTDWNICCRKVLNLPPSTRTYLIHNIKDTLPIRNIIMNRILNFFTSGVNHNCALISDFFYECFIIKFIPYVHKCKHHSSISQCKLQ